MGYGRWHQFQELDDEAIEELEAIFSDDALKENVYGISDQLDNGDIDEVLDTLYREWRRGARIRKDEVSPFNDVYDQPEIDENPVLQIRGAKPKDLDDLFPFNAFRHEVALQINFLLQGDEPLEGVREHLIYWDTTADLIGSFLPASSRTTCRSGQGRLPARRSASRDGRSSRERGSRCWSRRR